ncbi:MAG: formate dehydrogenase accessory sulfurtransferase FdhD [Actinomycetota bacterium]
MSEKTVTRAKDAVATEEPLEIRVQHRGVEHVISITMRTPGSDFELATGFLLAEGVVRSKDDVDRVQYCVGGPVEQQFNIFTVILRPSARFDPGSLARSFPMNSACGVCGKASLEALQMHDPPSLPDGPAVYPAVLRSLPETLRRQQKSFARTGGVHAAGLFEPGGSSLIVREDVGRHNAVDKVTGALLLDGRIPAGERVLQVSGRASYEIMQKALMAGIPFVSAVGAPSSLAVSLAEEFGMTLAGFVTAEGFNVYAGTQRVITQS